MSISLEICFIVQFGMFVTLSNCVCMVQVLVLDLNVASVFELSRICRKCLHCLGPKNKVLEIVEELMFS